MSKQLRVFVSADTKKFTGGMTKAQESMSKFKKSSKKTTKAVGMLSGAMGKLGAALAAGALINGMKKIISGLDDIDKGAKRAGMSIRDFQKMSTKEMSSKVFTFEKNIAKNGMTKDI